MRVLREQEGLLFKMTPENAEYGVERCIGLHL